MRKLVIAALLAGQFPFGVQAAAATGPAGAHEPRMGAFGGLRVRIPLDGDVRQRQVRAGLAVAPTLQTRSLQGESRTGIAEGIELSFRAGGPGSLSIGGTPVSQLAQGREGPDGRRLGLSPLGWVAIGAGAVAVGVAAWFYFTLADDDRCCE